jgi:hypothetical protein
MVKLSEVVVQVSDVHEAREIGSPVEQLERPIPRATSRRSSSAVAMPLPRRKNQCSARRKWSHRHSHQHPPRGYGVPAALGAAAVCFLMRMLGVLFDLNAPRPLGEDGDDQRTESGLARRPTPTASTPGASRTVRSASVLVLPGRRRGLVGSWLGYVRS